MLYIVLVKILYLPWKSKDYFLNGFSVKTIVLVGIYNQQFKGTILLWSLTSRVYIIPKPAMIFRPILGDDTSYDHSPEVYDGR